MNTTEIIEALEKVLNEVRYQQDEGGADLELIAEKLDSIIASLKSSGGEQREVDELLLDKCSAALNDCWDIYPKGRTALRYNPHAEFILLGTVARDLSRAVLTAAGLQINTKEELDV